MFIWTLNTTKIKPDYQIVYCYNENISRKFYVRYLAYNQKWVDTYLQKRQSETILLLTSDFAWKYECLQGHNDFTPKKDLPLLIMIALHHLIMIYLTFLQLMFLVTKCVNTYDQLFEKWELKIDCIFLILINYNLRLIDDKHKIDHSINHDSCILNG